MRKYGAVGLAAPQIGVSSQVFVIETTQSSYDESMRHKKANQPMNVFPLQVFINPKMKILDFTSNSYLEFCGSVCGLAANVPRAKKIQIEALDLTGKSFVWQAEGWAAKVAQHEMDHLQVKAEKKTDFKLALIISLCFRVNYLQTKWIQRHSNALFGMLLIGEEGN